MQDVLNVTFLATSLHRQTVSGVGVEWREYIKDYVACLYKRGIIKVTINRLKKRGLLIDVDEYPEELRNDPKIQQEV